MHKVLQNLSTLSVKRQSLFHCYWLHFNFIQRICVIPNKCFCCCCCFKHVLGKVPLKELDHTSLEKIHSYVDKELLTKPRVRNQSSQQVWLWHDDDELLQYEGLLEDYHDR